MKNLKYFSLLMAAGMFAACSDNLNVDSENGVDTGDVTPAYVTISVSSNVASSRASDTNTGTGNDYNHGAAGSNAEDSGLSNTGLEGEQQINDILLVALSENETSGFAKLYTNIATADEWEEVIDNTYKSPLIKLTTGKYNILVVANPYAQFGDNFSGETTDATTVKTLYDKIRDGQFTATTTEATAKAAADKLVGGDNRNDLMMSSKAVASVELKLENNSEQNPAVASVDIERTVSKITFRNTKQADITLDNVYKVSFPSNVEVETVTGNISDSQQGVTLNVAKDICSPVENTVYVYISGGTTQVYGAPEQTGGNYRLLAAKTQADYNAATAENKKGYYVVADIDKPTASLRYQFDEATAEQTDWYVRIEGYALTNLSKGVYHVRHTATDKTDETASPFGTLNGSNFLYTTNWADKNALDPTDEIGIATAVKNGDWFYNTLEQVSDESKVLTINEKGNFVKTGGTVQYYQKLPTTADEGSVTGGTNNPPSVGTFMAYCFENSTDETHQVHGLSTGISFVARMYADNLCQNSITELYKYNGYHFKTLDDIGAAFGNSLPTDVKNVIDKGDAATKTDLESVGIIKYASNICYYYTTEIKHFDNQDNSKMGIMEFAIMRNNIYSLAIKNVKFLGEPFVDPTPNIPNESNEALLQVEVKILPWIVRYNDIEF